MKKLIKSVVSLLCAGIIVVLLIYRANAQESTSISPTPSVSPSSSTPVIPDINPETLPDPAAFKLDQEIKQATRDFFNSLDKNEPFTILENKASRMKNLMKQAIKQYSYVFLGNVVPLSYTALLDIKLQSYFAKPLTLSSAELGVAHIDDFEKHENSRFDYSLQNLAEHKQFNFYPVGEFGGHISGTILNVNGVALDDEVSARVANAPQGGGGEEEEENNDPIVTNVEILKEASPDALGPQRVAVILLKEKQVQSPYYSKEQIEEIIFRGEVQRFIKEASYGKTWLDEDKSKVYGWYETDDVLNPYTVNFLKVIALTDPDIDFTQFDRVMIGVSKLSTYSDGRTSVNTGLGKGNVGKSIYRTADGDLQLTFSTFGIGSDSQTTFVHELGHNFGVYHANWLDCRESSIIRAKNDPDSRLLDGCLHVEYGNWLDVMGSGPLNHFNAYFKEVFGWLSEADKSIVSIRQDGVYNLKLKPLELNTGIVAKIVNQNGSNAHPFYIEYRIDPKGGPGSDIWIGHSGLVVNKVYNLLESHLLWPDPSQSYPLVNFLPQGKPFTDEKSGVTIINLGIDQVNQEAEIKVELGLPAGCETHSLDTEIYNIDAAALNSDGVYIFAPDNLTCLNDNCVLKRKQREKFLFNFSLKITNNSVNACPDIKIRAFIDKSPWGKDLRSESSSYIPSGRKYDYYASTMIPADTSPGTYNISVKVENTEDKSTYFLKEQSVTIIDDFLFLEGDLNNDQKVDIFDLVTVARDFGKKGEGLEGDADRDGKVDIFDLVTVAKNFGKKI